MLHFTVRLVCEPATLMNNTSASALAGYFASVAFLVGCGSADPSASKVVDAELSKNATFVALKRYDPAAYQAIANDVSTELAKGTDKTKIIAAIAKRVELVAVGRAATASDESVIAF